MKLFLASGESFEGESFGADRESEGEVVFTTGMAGYLETLTDPSYFGQILVFTFPLVGNYGVFGESIFKVGAKNPSVLPSVVELEQDGRTAPLKEREQIGIDQTFESKKIWVRGVVLTEESVKYSHCEAVKSFSTWLKDQGIPAISGVDTRELTQILREHGTILGTLGEKKPGMFVDSLSGRFVPEVSPNEVSILDPAGMFPRDVPTKDVQKNDPKTIAFLDCGAKNGILRNFLKRGIRIVRCPFDQNPFELDEKVDGLFISNGPGDPEQCTETIAIVKQALEKNLPIFGICLGNQILSLAVGGKTRKMKYGHRGVNQPVMESPKSKVQDQKSRCLITSQNHGFEVCPESLPEDFEVWFENLNDGSVEGIRHKTKPIFSVQFHPEASAGPEDAEYLFDTFIAEL